MKNPFKKQPNPKNLHEEHKADNHKEVPLMIDVSDIWDDLQIEIISDFIQQLEADLRYTIAELAEEVEDLREELEALKKPKIKVENIDASKIFYKSFK